MVHFWPWGMPSNQLGHVDTSLLQSFLHRRLTNNLCQALIDMSVKWHKRPHFSQVTLFIAFSSFILARDIWPTID